MMPRYPVYVISKGRPDRCLTARFLAADSIPFRLVVEPQEQTVYNSYGAERLLITPFSNLGQGSIPARNFVWEHALAAGHLRHWILDDNIYKIYRRFQSKRIPCHAGAALAATEDFIDRYENIAVAGLNYHMFLPERQPRPPFKANVHVYSCLLIKNDLPYRWRGRYNEDTDLCLQVLSGGWCTVLLNAFMIHKVASMKMKGGNTAELYQGDGRLKMARSLERLWPGIVAVDRRFQRPQHIVDWSKFTTPLKLRADISAVDPAQYALQLTQVKAIRSAELRSWAERQMHA
jgi:hypothetical protein